MASFSDEAASRALRLTRALSQGAQPAEALMRVIGVSQPTLSRTIQEHLPEVLQFRIKGVRTPQYALPRSPGGDVPAQQNIYQVDAGGAITLAGTVTLLVGGQTLIDRPHGMVLHDGLPPAMSFAAPSGFLGRQVARQRRRPGMPESLNDWSDDHRALHLFTAGVDLPGNLVFGDASLGLEMEFRTQPALPDARLPAHFETAASGLKEMPAGSSAGGEQPKFLCESAERGHLIVKFARVGTRMAELLPMEHLALRALEAAGQPAAPSRISQHGDHVYLEVERFDRVGRFGRRAVLSAGAVDDEAFGHRDTWSDFARRCVAARLLDEAAAVRIHTVAAFSELIGNTDRHFENISLFVDDRGRPMGVAPAYDVLPMRYAPIGGGIDPDLLPVQPKLGSIGGSPDLWRTAFDAAAVFWHSVAEARDVPAISPAMRQLAQVNLEVARAFVSPFVPAAPAARPRRRST